MEKKLIECIVCGQRQKTNESPIILLNQRANLRNPEYRPGLCPRHRSVAESGYMFLVGIDLEKSHHAGGMADPLKVVRIGQYHTVKQELAEKIFATDIPDSKVIYVSQDVLDDVQRTLEKLKGAVLNEADSASATKH